MSRPSSPGLVMDLLRNGCVQFRTTGGYVVAEMTDIRRWEMRLLERDNILVQGNVLDQSDVVELRVALETHIREQARAAGGAA